MKKILSLLTAITLTTSGASNVISCGITENTNQKTVDAIKAKMAVTTFSIQGASLVADASQDKSIIDKALQKANPSKNLTDNDLSHVTYSGMLIQKTHANITAAITIGTGSKKATATQSLKITWNQTNQQKVNEISAKMAVTTFSIQGESTKADASKPANNPIIDEALKQANPTKNLTDNDLSYVTYSGTLTPGTPATIKATITVGTGAKTATAEVNLSITWNLTDQQKADAIKAKIKVDKLSLDFTDSQTLNTNDNTTSTNIINALKKANNLKTVDINAIKVVAGQTITSQYALNKFSDINIEIIVRGVTLNKTLKIHYVSYNDETTAINNKITNLNIDLKAIGNTGAANADYKVSGSNSDLRKAIQNANPTLTEFEKNTFTFETKTISNGGTESITADIYLNTKKVATKNFNVTFTNQSVKELLESKLNIVYPNKSTAIQLDKTIFEGITKDGTVKDQGRGITTSAQDALRSFFMLKLSHSKTPQITDLTSLTIDEWNTVTFNWTGTLANGTNIDFKIGSDTISGYKVDATANAPFTGTRQIVELNKGLTLMPLNERDTIVLDSSKKYMPESMDEYISRTNDLNPMSGKGTNPNTLWSTIFFWAVKEVFTGVNNSKGVKYFNDQNLENFLNNDAKYNRHPSGGWNDPLYFYITPMTFDGNLVVKRGQTTTTPIEVGIRQMNAGYTTNYYIRTVMNLKINWKA